MAEKKKSIGANYIYNLIYQVLVLVVPFILTPYVSRVLSPEGIGEFSYVTTIAGYFVLVGNLGVATYGQLEIAKTRESAYERSKNFFEIFLVRSFTMVASLCVYIAYTFVGNSPYKVMYIVLMIQIFSSLFDISWFFQGLEEFKKIVIRNAVIKILGVVLVIIFVKKETDLYKYAFIMNGVILLGNMSLWSYLPKHLQKVKFSELKFARHLKQSVVYFIPSIATTIYLTLDKTMIEWFTSTTLENGYYEQAQKIEQMAVTAVTSLSVVTMPRMASLFKNKKLDELQVIFGKTIQFVLMIAIPMCVGMTAVAGVFIPVYLGSGYEKCVQLLQIFSILLIVVGLNNAFGKQILMPTGRQKQYNIGVILGAVINFILNMLLIPRFFSIGASIASVMAETVILFVFMIYSKDIYNGLNIIKLSIKYVIAAVVMFLAIKAVNCYINTGIKALVIQIACGVVVYFIVLIILRDSLVFEGIKKVKSILHKK